MVTKNSNVGYWGLLSVSYVTLFVVVVADAIFCWKQLVNSHFFENFEKNMRNLRTTVQGCLQAGFVIFCKKKIVQDPFFYTIDIFRPQDNELF